MKTKIVNPVNTGVSGSLSLRFRLLLCLYSLLSSLSSLTSLLFFLLFVLFCLLFGHDINNSYFLDGTERFRNYLQIIYGLGAVSLLRIRYVEFYLPSHK